MLVVTNEQITTLLYLIWSKIKAISFESY